MPDVEHARAMHGSIELLVLPLTSALTAAEAWSCSRAGHAIIHTEAGGEVPFAKHIPHVSNLSLSVITPYTWSCEGKRNTNNNRQKRLER
jgi:hypothetical protein